jgi:hypothetical protein
MGSSMRRAYFLVLVAGCGRCGEQRPSTPKPPDAAAAASAAASALPVEAGAPALRACEVVLLLDAKGDVLAFSPARRAITRVSHASCDLGGDPGPRSLAVEDDGTIWASKADGRVVRIHASDGRCAPTTLDGKQSGFAALNLTFAGATLWAADDHGWGGDAEPSRGLARVDRKSLALAPIGNPYRGGSSFLIAGTPDGGLYAEPPVTVDRLDPTKKKPTFTPLTAFEDFAKGQGVPMAYQSGSIYLFQTTVPPWRADVLRFDPATKKYTVVLPPAFDGTIVGAGAATCGS